jgi:outer membrane receptor for ferrienterochelin and colicins
MSFRYLIRTILCAMLLNTPGGAQDRSDSTATADSIISLDKIVVTATRSKRLISEIPASVSVITKKEIASSPAKTIEDLLITQTGVQATRPVAIGEGIPSSIIIRGIPGSLAASRTLILVDGFPTNASGTPFLIVNEIPMEAIERIEIVRGPYSSLYGANAVGGVVNILTKEGYGKANGVITGETSYPFSIVDQYTRKKASVSESLRKSGKMAYWNGNGTISGGNDKAGYLVSGGYRTIGNYLLADSALVRQGDSTYRTRPDNYDYQEVRLFGKGRWYCSDNATLTLNARFFNSDLGFGKTRTIEPESLDVVTKGNKLLVGPQLKWSVSNNIQVRAGAFYRRVVGEFFNEGKDYFNEDKDSLVSVPTWWKSTTNDFQIESHAIITLWHGNAVTAGVEFLDNNAQFGATINRINGAIMPNSFPVQKGIINSAGFLQDELTVFKKLTIVPALRLDHHSEFGSAVSPKLGLNYSLNDQIKLRASSGRSFRAPSLAELYLPDLNVNPEFLLVANPHLKPEYVWGSDAGFDFIPLRTLSFKLDIYYNSMNNLISQAVIFDSLQASVTHRNITKAWSEGVEGESSWRVAPWLLLIANGTLQDSRDEKYHITLDYVPHYTAGFTANGFFKIGNAKFEANAGIKQVGYRKYLAFEDAKKYQETVSGGRIDVPIIPLDPYNLINFACRMTLPSKIWYSLTVQNVFNVKAEEAKGSFTTGRFASIKTGLDF